MEKQEFYSAFRVVFLGIGLFVPGALLQNAPPFAVWVLPSLVRVGPADVPGTQSTASLYAARGDCQAVQIVIQGPAGGLSNVRVSASDLAGPGGYVIPSAHITLYRELFVQVRESSPNWNGANQPLGSGWYADPLVPFTDPDTGADLNGAAIDAEPFSVQAGANAAIWADVFVDRGAAAGEYTGSFIVAADQGSVTVPLALNVWNFELPATPSLKSSFAFWTPVPDSALAELIRHRLMPQRVSGCSPSSPAPCPVLPAVEKKLMDSVGLTMTDLHFWSGASGGNCVMGPAPSVAQFQAAAAQHQPGLFLFNYTADEIGNCTNLFPLLRQWALNMHQAGIDNLVVMAPTPELFDDGSGTGRSAVDIWVVLPKMYDAAAGQIARVLQKGDSVWSYNSLVQDSYSPKWEIDFDPLDYRLQAGFLSESLHLTGLLYWRVDRWSANPWTEVNKEGLRSSGNYPGEAMLVYPGAQVGISGVAPSMRLKYLRDGEQDYEYVEILKSIGQGDWALQTIHNIAADWSHWTRDPAALESVRRKLGSQIDAYYTQLPAIVSVSPSAAAGATQTLNVVVSDTAGYANLAGVNVLVGPTVDGTGACWIYYDATGGTLSLATDRGDAWNQIAAGSSGTLQNSQCTLQGAGSSAAGSGNRMTLSLNLSLQPVFAGQQKIYVRVQNQQGKVTGYQAMGTWTVPGAP